MPVPSGIPQLGPAVQTEDRWGWAGPWAVKRIEDAGRYTFTLMERPEVGAFPLSATTARLYIENVLAP